MTWDEVIGARIPHELNNDIDFSSYYIDISALYPQYSSNRNFSLSEISDFTKTADEFEALLEVL